MQDNLAHFGVFGPHDLWDEVLRIFFSEVDPQVFAAYLSPLKVGSWSEENREFVIVAPSRLVCNHVESNYRSRIADIIARRMNVDPSLVSVRLIVEVPSAQTKQAQTPESNRRTRVVVVRGKYPDDRWRGESNAVDSLDAQAHSTLFNDSGFPDSGFPDSGFPDSGFADTGFNDTGSNTAGRFGASGFSSSVPGSQHDSIGDSSIGNMTISKGSGAHESVSSTTPLAGMNAQITQSPVSSTAIAPVQATNGQSTNGQRLQGNPQTRTGLTPSSGRFPAERYVVERIRPAPSNHAPNGLSSNSQGLSSQGSHIRTEVAAGPAVPTNISQRYTFSDFVVGNNNQFCHAAAMRVAELPGRSYNPLFIYGGVGLGKTHLLHAIGNAVLQTRPSAKVLYMSSEMFTNELIQALRNAKMEEFKKRLRTIDVLLIDDIQFISGKERTQEEFFHTFNTLYSAKHQIVITSDKIPTDIPGIEERLQTRFSWGLTADLQAPDFETRVAILKRKAFLDSFHLPEDVGHFIAERVSSNVRELEGALTRLHAVSSLQNLEISLDMARQALKHLMQPKTVHVSVDDIKRAVATHFNVKVSEIISKRRTKNLSFPRHIAMYLCRKHTTASYPEIGGHFGGRDHSSVIHAANVVSSKVASDHALRGMIEEIERQLLGGH